MVDANLLPYLSHAVLRRLDHADVRGVERFDGAYVFFDISGFTSLSELLNSKGQEGVETLNRVLSSLLGPLADICIHSGGDIIYFAGDGVGVLFRPEEGATLGSAASRAARAAAQVVEALTRRIPGLGFELGIRASIGAGRCIANCVGEPGERWLLVVDGPAVQDAYSADRVGTSGSVNLAESARALLGPGFATAPQPNGFHRLLEVPAARPAELPDGRRLPSHLHQVARSFLPPALVSSLDAGTEAWLAELRPVVAIFVSLPGVGVADPLLQKAVEIAQREMRRVDGVLHSIIGDKGLGLLCALGLPPHAHEDDSARAIDAAMAMRLALHSEGLDVGIGVEVGRVHCGVVGSELRRQYDLYGPSLAMSARLMQLAAGSGIRVGPAARAQAEGRIDFAEPVSVELKGFHEPVQVFEPTSRRRARRLRSVEMVGRGAILRRISARVAQRGKPPGAVLIEAEAGMGKSMLLEQILADELPEGLRVLQGAADSVETNTSMYALRGLIAGLFAIDNSMSRERMCERVLGIIGRDVPEKRELAPLLDVVLKLELPDTELTAQFSPGVRAENFTELVVALFVAAAEREPLLLVVEDMHWMDLGSWSMLATLLDRVPGILLVGSLRPMVSPPPQLAQLTTGPGRELHRLEPLDSESTGLVIARCLGVSTVSREVIEAVHARSEGVPFFSEEVAYALREAGALRINRRHCELADDRAVVALPNNVTGVITGRIDRLPTPIQLSLKVASVLGRYFTLAALVAVHPLLATAEDCASHTRQLVEAALVSETEAQPGSFYFRHALTHETAYSLLTPSQRKSLHQAAALQMEAEHAENLSPYFSRLTDHWRLAEEPAKAAHYSARAGEQALQTYASRSAIAFLEQALVLDTQVRGPRSIDLERARWHQLLGDAWYSAPDPAKARQHLEECYVLSGFPRPRFGAGTLVELVKHVIGRYRTPPAPDDELRARCRSALKAFDSLSVVCLWSGDRLGLVHVVFASDNLGRLGGQSPESALVRNMVGYSLVLGGLRSIGERDMRAAFTMAEEVRDLYARIVTHVFLGLTLSLLGRVEEAEPLLRKGWDLSREMGGGLWLHRADYMLGECMDISGRYEEAIPFFRSCAEIARGAEPHTVGFANASALLCELRLGADPARLLPELLDEEKGVPITRKEKGYNLQVSLAVAVQQEVLLRLGRYDEVWALAQEMMDLVESGDDTYSYFRGSTCHTANAMIVHALWERKRSGVQGLQNIPEVSVLEAQARRALKHLRRGYRTFPAVEAKYRLFVGVHHRLRGEPAKAREELRRCITYAERARFPWEQVVAHVELARLSEGEDRLRHVAAARTIATSSGLKWEVSDAPCIGVGFPHPTT